VAGGGHGRLSLDQLTLAGPFRAESFTVVDLVGKINQFLKVLYGDRFVVSFQQVPLGRGDKSGTQRNDDLQPHRSRKLADPERSQVSVDDFAEPFDGFLVGQSRDEELQCPPVAVQSTPGFNTIRPAITTSL
jgi:hypothetical protein